MMYSPVSPFPSCPNSDEPAVNSCPVELRSALTSCPHAALTILTPSSPSPSPATTHLRNRSDCLIPWLFTPSCPHPFPPDAYACPSLPTSTVWYFPTAAPTKVTSSPSAPAADRGVGTGTAAEEWPSPSWPVSFRPHPYASPRSVMATECAAVGDVATNATFDPPKTLGNRSVGAWSSWARSSFEMPLDRPGIVASSVPVCASRPGAGASGPASPADLPARRIAGRTGRA
mmetsp:Transcript_10367/g.23663  ORF Transcript_10367/g.23663 Transcript_10367/m.23663 type:complete len:230 (+) Transcript_10367:986-1675(+)